MNGIILRRIVWKEYREIRSFWLALFALGTLLQVLPAMFEFIPADSLLRVGWVISTLFAVGCAGTIFAREHEEGTFNFLRMLPSAGRTVFVGKLLLAAIATLMLLFALFAVASVVTTVSGQARGRGLMDLDKFSDFTMHGEFVRMWGVAVVEGIAWGTFFSLVLRRPLQATLVAVAIASVSAQLMMSIATPSTRNLLDGGYPPAAPYRLLLALLVLAVDFLLAKTWLHGTEFAWSVWPTSHVQQAAALAPSISARTSARPRVSTIMGRLVWQEIHESWRVIAGLCGASILLPVVLTSGFDRDHIAMASMIGLFFWAALMGAFVYRADQRRGQFRFFTDRGIRPTHVWLSRQFVWVSALLTWAFLVFLGWFVGLHGQFDAVTHFGGYWELPSVFVVLCFVVLAYVAGQYVSIFIRSGILSGLAGIILAVVMSGWAALMMALQVPVWWSVLPIVLALLIGSWARSGDWLAEKRSWRARLKAGSIVGVPLAMILLAIPFYRVLEVPILSPSDLPAQLMYRSRQSPNVNDCYSVAFRQFVVQEYDRDASEVATGPLTPDQSQFLAANAESLEQLLAARSGQMSAPELRFEPRGLIELLFISARQCAADGQFDAAWMRYEAAFTLVRFLEQDTSYTGFSTYRFFELSILRQIVWWAGRAGQTPERLQAAIENLAHWEKTAGRPQNSVARDYRLLQSALDGDPAAIDIVQVERQLNLWPEWLWRVLFWERLRAKRVISELTASNMNDLAMLDDLINNGVAATPWLGMASFQRSWRGPAADQPTTILNYINRGTPSPPGVDKALLQLALSHLSATDRVAATPMIGRYFDGNPYSYGSLHLTAVTHFRATQTLLGMQAWKLEHGTLPKVLDELVGPVFAALPLDPLTGKPFLYSSEPLAFTVPERYLPDSDGKPEAERLVPLPTRAFIWSPTNEVVVGQSGDESERLQRKILKSSWFEVPGGE